MTGDEGVRAEDSCRLRIRRPSDDYFSLKRITIKLDSSMTLRLRPGERKTATLSPGDYLVTASITGASRANRNVSIKTGQDVDLQVSFARTDSGGVDWRRLEVVEI